MEKSINVIENLMTNVESSFINEREEEEEKEEDKDEIDILKEKGYDEKMVKKVYIFLKPINQDKAEKYMSKKDGLYQHNFFPYSFKKNDKCLICDGKEEEHIEGKKRIKFKLKSKSNKSEKGLIKLLPPKENTEDPKICELCGEHFNDDEFFQTKIPCGHFFCTQCWMEYLNEKLSESKIEKIKCMAHKCSFELLEDFIKNIIKADKSLERKFPNYQKRINILKDPNNKLCPYPNCSSYGKLRNDNDKYIKCELGHKFCYNCLKPWHGKEECSYSKENDLNIWKQHNIIKQCPKCKIYIEKNSGSNEMSCTQCDYNWCWICRSKCGPYHYSFGGSCAGLEYSNNELIQNNCVILYCYKYFVMLLSLILSSIFWIALSYSYWIFSKLEDYLIISIDSGLIGFLFFFPSFCCYTIFGIEIFSFIIIPCLFYLNLFEIILEKYFDFMEM